MNKLKAFFKKFGLYILFGMGILLSFLFWAFAINGRTSLLDLLQKEKETLDNKKAEVDAKIKKDLKNSQTVGKVVKQNQKEHDEKVNKYIKKD